VKARVTEVRPGVVRIAKRGRPVSVASARAALARAYPDVPVEEWEIGPDGGHHHTSAVRRVATVAGG